MVQEGEKKSHLCNCCGGNKRRSPALHSSSQEPPLAISSVVLPPPIPHVRIFSCNSIIPSSTAGENKDEIIKKVQAKRWRRLAQYAETEKTQTIQVRTLRNIDYNKLSIGLILLTGFVRSV